MGHGSFERGEQLAQRRFERAKDLRTVVETLFDGGGEVVRGAASAKGDAVVGGALTVDDQVSIVGERLVAREADLVPEAWTLGLRGDHERVQGRDAASLAGQRRGEALGRAHHVLRVHVGEGGDRSRPFATRRRKNSRDRRVLVDGDTQALGHLREAAHEARRM